MVEDKTNYDQVYEEAQCIGRGNFGKSNSNLNSLKIAFYSRFGLAGKPHERKEIVRS